MRVPPTPTPVVPVFAPAAACGGGTHRAWRPGLTVVADPADLCCVDHRIQQRSFHIHNAMIRNAKASVDCKPGRVQRRRNYKKEQMEEGAWRSAGCGILVHGGSPQSGTS